MMKATAPSKMLLTRGRQPAGAPSRAGAWTARTPHVGDGGLTGPLHTGLATRPATTAARSHPLVSPRLVSRKPWQPTEVGGSTGQARTPFADAVALAEATRRENAEMAAQQVASLNAPLSETGLDDWSVNATTSLAGVEQGSATRGVVEARVDMPRVPVELHM